MCQGTLCVKIIDSYFKNIAKNYEKYVGQRLDVVIKKLSKDHVVKPYQLRRLQNNDVVIWRSRKDNLAHVTIYCDNRFIYTSPDGIKSHPVLVKYKKMLEPMYIVRLKGV